ncbi:hypothetical protein KFK09_014768 [Dendrobium nobile]|uniref:Uncharacterized protein n=1 Tax=Dendrobium nobile TaxID=94219 RepID=A0A8T3B4A8_DENNO|nr:hypothetical protein KFK09_014768 [Dendrobium nobile]
MEPSPQGRTTLVINANTSGFINYGWPRVFCSIFKAHIVSGAFVGNVVSRMGAILHLNLNRLTSLDAKDSAIQPWLGLTSLGDSLDISSIQDHHNGDAIWNRDSYRAVIFSFLRSPSLRDDIRYRFENDVPGTDFIRNSSNQRADASGYVIRGITAPTYNLGLVYHILGGFISTSFFRITIVDQVVRTYNSDMSYFLGGFYLTLFIQGYIVEQARDIQLGGTIYTFVLDDRSGISYMSIWTRVRLRRNPMINVLKVVTLAMYCLVTRNALQVDSSKSRVIVARTGTEMILVRRSVKEIRFSADTWRVRSDRRVHLPTLESVKQLKGSSDLTLVGVKLSHLGITNHKRHQFDQSEPMSLKSGTEALLESRTLKLELQNCLQLTELMVDSSSCDETIPMRPRSPIF